MEGGFVTTDNEELYHILLSIRAHGWTRNLPKKNFVANKSDNWFEESFRFVLPVYNVEKYVRETLISVQNQTSEPDEVIIINDGSTDNSFQVIKEFEELNNWKIYKTENQGLGLTRNYGKSLTKSEYIYFLDSDDLIEKNFIHEIRKMISLYDKPDMILFSGKTFQKMKL